MNSETVTVHQLFQDRRQYRVPFYQRPYVWSRDAQWKPLWTDIIQKAESRLENNSVPPAPHFLGAIVLEPQPRDGLRGVEALHVIDGQQRLTTLQYVLSALSMAIRECKADDILPIINGCVWNPNPDTMKQPAIEVFKVWPTFRDRQTYELAMHAQTRDELRSRFPQNFTQSGSLKRIGIDHPPALDAIWFFRQQIEDWLAGQPDRPERLEKLAEAIFQDLKVVSISLEQQDDAQVIFETLNGRGTELHATDLIRNFIFMRTDRDGANSGNLYDTLWSQFEGSFWAESQRRGRLNRPRVEWFMQSTLQAELAEEIDVGRLYEAYRRFAKPMPAEQQLERLSSYADKYRHFILGTGDEPIGQFGRQIAVWDASPIHAVALAIAGSRLSVADQSAMYSDLVSYVVRRAICGLSNKSYNKTFLQLLKRLREGDFSPANLRSILSAQKGETSRWPTDEEFLRVWINDPIIPRLGEMARVRFVLAALEKGMRTARTEENVLPDMAHLDVEHVLPERWLEHWPIDGVAVTEAELQAANMANLLMDEASDRQKAISKRERLNTRLAT